jgi:hypothetical protein
LTAHLDLADYLLIAEAVLGVPAEEIARWPGMGLAESALHAPAAGFAGVEFYQDVIDKAAATDPAVAQPGYREWLRRGSPGAGTYMEPGTRQDPARQSNGGAVEGSTGEDHR